MELLPTPLQHTAHGNFTSLVRPSFKDLVKWCDMVVFFGGRWVLRQSSLVWYLFLTVNWDGNENVKLKMSGKWYEWLMVKWESISNVPLNNKQTYVCDTNLLPLFSDNIIFHVLPCISIMCSLLSSIKIYWDSLRFYTHSLFKLCFSV